MSKRGVSEIIVGLVLVALLTVGFLAVKAYRAPLAEPLTIIMQATATSSSPSVATPEATAAPAADTSKKVCGLSKTMDILVIGRDEFRWEKPYGADAIRMVRLDFDNRKVTVFAFQRDLLMDTPNLKKDFNVETYKLGEAYVLVRENEKEKNDKADIKATSAIAQILFDNFGIKPDRYMTIEENVVGEITETLGGVEVDVKEAVTLPKVSLKPGVQVLSGETAMDYARYLVNGLASQDEWGRLERQAAVFSGLRDKLFSVQVLPKIPQLYKDINKSLVTDLSPQEITNLTCFGNEVTTEDIESQTIARDDLNIEADETMIIKEAKKEGIDKLLQELFAKK